MQRRAFLQQCPRAFSESAADEHLAHEIVAVGVGGVRGDSLLEPRHRRIRAPQCNQCLAPDDAGLDRARMMFEAALADFGRTLRVTCIEQVARELDEDPRPWIGLQDALVLLDDRG